MGGDHGEWLGVQDEVMPAVEGRGGAEAPQQPAVERRAGVQLRNAVIRQFA